MRTLTKMCSLLHKICAKLSLSSCARTLASSSVLEDIRQQLQKYQGGSVDFVKNSDTGIAILTLNNPKRKNALTGSMMVELADHVTRLSQWEEGKAMILRGADSTFCSGGDLKTVAAILNSQDGERMSTFMHDTLTRLHALPLVSLALLQGVAVGGGAELATACDFRAMTPDARVGFVQIKMGVTTGWGGATRLFQLLGRRKTLDLLCSGKLLDADTALSLGFTDHILHGRDSALALSEAEALLLSCCTGPVQLVRAVKRMVTSIQESGTITEALEEEKTVFATFWGGEYQKKALEKNIKHS